jgi:sn-glycerol 3-phosphate transport system substrate-binding protein
MGDYAVMQRRTLLAGAATLGLAAPALAQAPVEIQFWHGLSQPLGGLLEQRVAAFNASQQRFKVVPTYRGSYPETMVAAIAAFRANSAPHIVQMFEVGTGTMMAAGRAIKPVHELLAETGVSIDFDDYLPGVRGYYSLSDGRMMSMPFNSSTAIVWYNKDAFRRAGLNPDSFPTTYQALAETLAKLKAGGSDVPMSTAWPTWAHVENFSAIHDIPLATKGNGFGGLDTEMRINNPVMLRHMQNLVDWQKAGLFRYGGRTNVGEPAFPKGEAAILTTSSGFRARVQREAQFAWGVAMLPYYEGTPRAPLNSIIGGASFWAMTKGPAAGGGRTPDEYRGVAEFYRYLSQPEVDAQWHMDTGYVPVRRASYAIARDKGFYRDNPGADVPIEQLLRGGGQLTENSRGIRLGGFVEIRTIMEEEMERAFQGQQTAEQVLANSTTRANQVLRNFERANRG